MLEAFPTPDDISGGGLLSNTIGFPSPKTSVSYARVWAFSVAII
jgi:hypothetical protein